MEDDDIEPKKPLKIASKNIGMIITKANELCDFIKEVDPMDDRHSALQC